MVHLSLLFYLSLLWQFTVFTFREVLPSDPQSIGPSIMSGTAKVMTDKIIKTSGPYVYYPTYKTALDYEGNIKERTEVRWTKEVDFIKGWKQLS